MARGVDAATLEVVVLRGLLLVDGGTLDAVGNSDGGLVELPDGGTPLDGLEDDLLEGVGVDVPT